jgi:hypothetical protein
MTIQNLLDQYTNNLPDTYSVKRSKTCIEVFDENMNNTIWAHLDGRIYRKEFKFINGQWKETVVSGMKRDSKTGNLTPFRRESYFNENGTIKYETSTDGRKNDNNVYRKIIGLPEEKVEPRKIPSINKSTELF